MTARNERSITHPRIRLLSIVEATSVTGPVKPLLMFSALARAGVGAHPPVDHRVVTTRRPALMNAPGDKDLLRNAAAAAGVDFAVVPERRAGDPRVAPLMRDAIRAFRPHILESHDSKSHFVVWLLRLRYADIRAIPWVAFHHGYTRTSFRVRLYQQLDRVSLRHATRVNTLCKPFARQLSDRGVKPARINVLTNAVTERSAPDAATIRELRASLNALPEDCVLLAVGRLSREKGMDDLLDAFAHASRASKAPLRLVIAGDGPERGRLETRAGSDRIHFLGHVTDPWPLYHAADAFVLPSHSEGSPLVIFEAMAAGLPIVATAVGGVPEVLTNDVTALLVEPRNVSQLAAGLVRLADDPALRTSLASAARAALRRHSPEAYSGQLLGIYDAALGASS
jgi:glycosyltransferase involved in cell wall biosynthesis